MIDKRITIYDIASSLGISASYVSRALNNHPTISEKIKQLVNKKADELNYKQNSFAANLRKGLSKIIGVIVPKINETFFSNVISGIEEIARKHKYHVIICQTDESFKNEVEAVNTLIGQNVDGILISLSSETKSNNHLQEILNNQIKLVQFDRYDHSIPSFIIENDNKEAAFAAVQHLIEQGYKQIAYMGGPEHLEVFKLRKQGYIDAINKFKIKVPKEFYSYDTLLREKAKDIAIKLLNSKNPPDAFFTASDYAAIGVLQAAKLLNIDVPSKLGVVGFQNETFASFITPSLTSVNQNPIEIGKLAANVFFNNFSKTRPQDQNFPIEIVRCDIEIRETSTVLDKFQ